MSGWPCSGYLEDSRVCWHALVDEQLCRPFEALVHAGSGGLPILDFSEAKARSDNAAPNQGRIS